MTQLVESLSFLSVWTYKVATWFSDLKQEFKRQQLVNHTINELSALTDKELNDIGISRCMIRSVAEDTYRD